MQFSTNTFAVLGLASLAIANTAPRSTVTANLGATTTMSLEYYRTPTTFITVTTKPTSSTSSLPVPTQDSEYTVAQANQGSKSKRKCIDGWLGDCFEKRDIFDDLEETNAQIDENDNSMDDEAKDCHFYLFGCWFKKANGAMLGDYSEQTTQSNATSKRD